MRNSTKWWIGAAAVASASAAAAAAAAFLLDRHPVGNRNVPEPAKSVDLDRYLGDWFEIARYDQRFERSCDSGVKASYSRRGDGSISVVNRCRRSDGTVKEARGRAKIVDRATNAKLKVSFFGPFYGDYWVLDHGEDYNWSIVGEPSGRYLWILNRSANPGKKEIDSLVARARNLGYDTSLLIYTKQP
jgi:apolipoprotein D and lipocalin family protein